MTSTREKLRALFEDTRRYPRRALAAFPVLLSAMLTLVFFCIADLCFYNYESIPFKFALLLFVLLAASLAAAAALSLVCALLKGKPFEYALVGTLALNLCFFVQKTFLNNGITRRDVTQIYWFTQVRHAMLDTLVWAGIIFAVCAVFTLSGKAVRKKMFAAVLTLVFLAQLVPFFITAVPFVKNGYSQKSDYCITNQNLLSLSEKENIIVFVLDSFDESYFELLSVDGSRLLEPFRGFTHYTNTLSSHARTKAAIPFLLTGSDFDYTNYNSFLGSAWKNASFLSEMKSEGFELDIYTPGEYILSSESTESVRSLVSNISPIKQATKTDYRSLLSFFARYSAFEHLPHIMKAPFTVADEELDAVSLPAGESYEDGYYSFDSTVFYQHLLNNGLHTGGDSSRFKFYHLDGVHLPATMNADGTKSSTQTDNPGEVKGCFTIIGEYINRLKELGLFESSSIIVTADHGRVKMGARSYADTPLLLIKPAGTGDGEELLESDAPVWDRDYFATFAQLAGIDDYQKHGQSILTLEKTAARSRRFVGVNYDKGSYYLITFEVNGKSTNIANWREVSRTRAENFTW